LATGAVRNHWRNGPFIFSIATGRPINVPLPMAQKRPPPQRKEASQNHRIARSLAAEKK
jgi:hypothetical protein